MAIKEETTGPSSNSRFPGNWLNRELSVVSGPLGKGVGYCSALRHISLEERIPCTLYCLNLVAAGELGKEKTTSWFIANL